MKIYTFDHVPSQPQTMTWDTYIIVAEDKQSAIELLKALTDHRHNYEGRGRPNTYLEYELVESETIDLNERDWKAHLISHSSY